MSAVGAPQQWRSSITSDPRPHVSSIPEQHTQDRTIVNSVIGLTTHIDLHVGYYYPRDLVGSSHIPEFNDPRTRLAMIRQRIAWEIINHIVMADRDSSDADLSARAHEISASLEGFSSSQNGEREAHLWELCRLGAQLRGLMRSHPSQWTFGSWNEVGFVMLFPALLKDGVQVVDRQIFRT
ncbi:MAG: hypothetical protein M1839_004205 [Geoglossum umbratile]|nr:MAG: hypothetical protein M1839_004205 [Geoglossum umbratile]